MSFRIPVRQKQPGEPNKPEKRYIERLQLLQAAGEVVWWAYEPIRLRLAHGCFYTPDFQVITPTETGAYNLELHEVKVMWRVRGGPDKPGILRDGRVKLHTAAELNPYYTFVLAIEQRDKSWQLETIPPSAGGPLTKLLAKPQP